MRPAHVVVGASGLDAAAAREVAALADQQRQSPGGSSPQEAELYRQLQQAARDVEQQSRAAAQEARAAAQEAARAGVHVQSGTDIVTIPAPPGSPGVPRITKGLDGRMTIVGPDGSTTILEPDGRYTVINAKGQVTQSPHSLTPQDYGMDPGAALSLSALTAFVFFFVGRWWTARKYRGRAAEGAIAGSGELGGRMERIEQAVEAVAIEVERISEGQRFTTKLLSEIRSPGPVAVGEPQR